MPGLKRIHRRKTKPGLPIGDTSPAHTKSTTRAVPRGPKSTTSQAYGDIYRWEKAQQKIYTEVICDEVRLLQL